jgi:iron complex transport system ATP-binding protein
VAEKKLTVMNFCEGQNIVLHRGRNIISAHPFDFAFPRGQLTALVGPNGSGKTTLLNAILGEPTLAAGTIRLGWPPREITALSPREIAQTLAYVPQEHDFTPSLLLVDYLRMAYLAEAGMFGALPPREHPPLVEIIKRLGLFSLKDRRLENLSTGERQRVFLARALLQGSRVVLLDEPTNHLDPGGIKRFWRHLGGEKDRLGFEVIVSTHDLDFVTKQSQWVCVLVSGSCVFSGSTRQCLEEKWLDRIYD